MLRLLSFKGDRDTPDSNTGDLTLETGTLEYSNIKDKDKSYNVGGGANFGSTETSKGDKTNYSANANYEFSDKKQTNFATIGEGTIIVKDSETDLTDLKRDITLAQYNTKEGGLKGGVTVDDALVDLLTTNPIDTYNNTVDALKKGYDDAKNTVNKITDTVVEAAKNLLGDVFKTKEEIQKENDDAAIKVKAEEAKKKLQEILAKVTADTKEVIEQMGWDGEKIENTKNLDVLNQTDKAMLIKYGLPPEPGACMFLSKVYAVADTLGISLTPEEMGEIYKTAKENGAVFKQGTNGKKDSAYWVNDYQGILESVASVKGVDAGGASIPKAMIPLDLSSSKEATKNMIETLKNGGSAEIRYDKDPTNPDSNAHSMRVLGSFIENGNIILSIKDTYSPDKKTYVDTSTMELYTLDKKGKPVYSKRPVSSYLPITKN